MSRSLRLTGYIVIGVIAGLLLAAAAIFVLTRTDWGMERARRFAVSWLADRVDGELRIGRITGPGLLGGVVVHDFGIIDPKGRPFLSADSVELAYNLRTLLGGEIVISRAALYNPSVVLEQLPGDTAWNYQYVFPDRTPGDDTPRTRDLILIRDAVVINGTATVRTPLAEAIAAGDTSRILVDRFPGGLARAMRFENINARLDRVIWESPLEEGRLIDVQSASLRGFYYRDPFVVEDTRGTITIRDTIVAFDMPHVELPSSDAAVLGRVIMQEGRNDFDVRVEGNRFVFRDLQWLFPQLPEEGGGSAVLRIQTQPNGTLFLAEDARISAPGTSLSGTFGIVTGDTLYFTQVDLRASPLDVDFIEQLLPGGLPIDGLLVGTVEVSGPLSALETSGDLRLEGNVPGAGSDVAWTGVFDVRGGRVNARSFDANVRRLELALVAAFAPQLRVGGSVSGTVSGSGRPDNLKFTALLEHASSDGGRSVFDGGGTLEGGGRSRRLDLDVTASPVTFADLAQQVPALQGLQGELTGPVHISGPIDDLGFEAALTTPGGPLHVRGRVQQLDDVHRVTADAEARGFLLHAFRSGLPHTVASGVMSVDLVGGTFGTMRGPVRLELDSTRFGELPHSTLLVEASLDSGVLVVDSAVLRGSLGTGRGRGTLALLDGRSGQLDVSFGSETLAALEPFIYRGGPAADGEARVSGRLEAVGTFTGWLRDLGMRADLRATDVLVGPASARTVRAELRGDRIGTDAMAFHLDVVGDSLLVAGHELDAASIVAVAAGDSVAVSLEGTSDHAQAIALRAAAYRTTSPDTAWSRAVLHSLSVGTRSPWVLAARAELRRERAMALLDSLVFSRDGGGRVRAAGRLAWDDGGVVPASRLPLGRAPLEFSVRFANVPFEDLLLAARARFDGAGSLDGILRLTGTPLDPFIEAEVSARNVVYGDVRLDHAFAEATYASLGIDAHAEAQYGGRSILTGGGRIPVDLRLATVTERRLDEPLRFTLAADSLPPALPLGMVSGFSNIAGRIDGIMTVGGTTLDPSLSGGFTVRNGAADWSASGVRYRDVDGTFTLERDRILSVDLTAASTDARGRRPANGAGTGTITGTLNFTELTNPALDLRLVANGAFAARRRDVEAQVSGEVRLGGHYNRPEISGVLNVDEGALYIEELYRQFLIAGVQLDDPMLFSIVDTSLVSIRPLIAASQNPFLKNLQVRDLQLNATAGSWLRSRDMDVEVSGRLAVSLERRGEDIRRGESRGEIRLTGSMNVERGTYTLYYPPLQSRRFQVRGGTIDFVGTPGIDPNLSITAAYKARTAQGEPLDVLAVVSGTLQAPRVRLTSDAQPPISESDLASYLFFGVPTAQRTAGQNGDMVAGLGMRTLEASVLGYASSGLQTLVQSAGLLDYVGITTAEGRTSAEPNDEGLANILEGTQLEFGRYLRPDLFMGMTTRLGTTNIDFGDRIGARVEWRFLPQYSFELFAEDRLARAPALGIRQELGLRKVYGFLLFREWGF